MKALLWLSLLILLEAPKAHGAFGYVVPADPGPGNSSLAGPFNPSPSSRLQQVYGHGGDGFGPISTNYGYLIEGVYFRLDESAGPFNETFPSVQVDLSTTSRSPDGLSTLFSENIGADQTTVFGPGPLHLSGTLSGFTVGFMFERSFLYDPAAGNLLLDIRNFGPGNASPLDAFAVVGDSVSTVSNGLDVNAPAGGLATHGLATMFWVDIVPVPEPSAFALLLVGLLGLSWRLHRVHRSSLTSG